VAVPGRAGHVWIPTPWGLLRSSDGGTTFQRVTPTESIGEVGFGKAAPGERYPTVFVHGRVGGADGVFRSVDEGRTWLRINTDAIQFATRNVITGDPRVFGRVYLGTNTRGILVAYPVP